MATALLHPTVHHKSVLGHPCMDAGRGGFIRGYAEPPSILLVCVNTRFRVSSIHVV